MTDGFQLGQDGLLGHAELGKFHTRGHHHQPLHLIQHGGGEIAKAHLLPHIGKQLGVGGAAVQGVAHQQRCKLGMVHHHPAGAEAQGQLALGDVHGISDLPHLAALGTVHHLAHHRGLSGREQGCKGASNGLLHPLHIGRTTIIKSNTAGPEQSPIMVPQLLGRHAAGGLGIPQLVHRIGLLGAHLLYQPEDGPAPLVVDPGSNAVGQIGPLAGHKILGKHPVLRVRVQQNFTHQGKGRLQHCHTVQGIVIVNKAALESHALALSPLTDRRAQGCAVELVRSSGQALHVGMVPTAPIQDIGN